jgi:hypothetical protein
MRLIPVPLTEEGILALAPHWLPFLPLIARRSKETVRALRDQVENKQMRIALVWDDAANKATALVGVRVHMRGDDMIGELLWMAGYGRQQWEHLLPDLENMLRQVGCVECRPLCRPGWARAVLKKHGYRITHVQMEKSLR